MVVDINIKTREITVRKPLTERDNKEIVDILARAYIEREKALQSARRDNGYA